ncbi:MAG: hypothetical protein CO129_03620 [Ignavibacteriales bacterium CG_4_9_14_3_um_filter_34_10]|nr:MAG: hypothetical protein CO129_03620 [Ignavibacteriales bacterium CG_4_9_14_3_um_filter_34_10]
MYKSIILILAIISINLFAQQKNNVPFLIENGSELSFTQTIDSLKNCGNRNGWKVLTIHDLQQSLKKNGKEVLPVNVIELCNPKYSYEVLKDDNSKLISTMMPCRISVYEKANGKTYISRINPEFLYNSFDSSKSNGMSKAIEEIESIINKLIVK